MGLFRSQGNSNVFKQTTQPTTWSDGDLWIDLSQTPRVLNINSNGTVESVFLGAQSNITVAGVTNTLEHFLIMGAV